jgi:hypothetical protein
MPASFGAVVEASPVLPDKQSPSARCSSQSALARGATLPAACAAGRRFALPPDGDRSRPAPDPGRPVTVRSRSTRIHPDNPDGWGDWYTPALSVADSRPNRGSDSSSAFAWTYGWRFGTEHSRTARRPASLAAMSARPCVAGNDVCSSPTALAPMRISLRSPAQAPAPQSIPCAAARGPHYRGSASLSVGAADA